MHELHRRVELLERLLAALARPPARHVDATLEAARLEWDACSLLASILSASIPAHDKLDRAAVTELIADSGLLAQLEDQGTVRWILGRLQIASSARMIVARAKGGRYDGESWVAPIPAPTIAVLSRLVEAVNARESEPLTIAQTAVAELREAHSRVHHNTPSLDAISELLGLRHPTREDPSLVLRPNPQLLDRAAAELWISLTRDPSRSRADVFDAWFLRIGSEGAIDAATHLPQLVRLGLLDEMVDRVLAEKDLGDYSVEWKWVLAEDEDLGAHLQAPEVPTGNDIVDTFPWWRGVDKVLGERASGEMRTDVSSLIHAIVLHDPLDGAYGTRGARILRLLDAGRERVFVARSVAQTIVMSRPEAIPTLLVHARFQRLGLKLLTEVNIDDDAFVGWTAEQQQRRGQRVRLAWSEGASIALEVLSALTPDEAGTGIAHLSLPLAIEATADLTYTVQRQSRADAEVRLDETLRLLEALESRSPHHGQRSRLINTAAKQAICVVERMTAPDDVPTGAFRLLFWLLDAHASAAVAAINVLRHWLVSGHNGWSHDHPGVAALPWGRVLRIADAATFEAFVTMPPTRLERETEWEAANRQRLFMRVLAKSHGAFANRTAPTPDEAQRRDTLETAIIGQLVASGAHKKFDQLNPFGRLLDWTSYGANVEDLTYSLARAVDSFSPARRDQALDQWLGISTDPLLLLRAASAMHAMRARQLVEGRLTGLNLEAELANESTVAVAAMADEAVGLRLRSLAEQLLAVGGKLFDNDRLRDQWQADSLKPRLAIAALSGDQIAFEALAGTSHRGYEFQRGLLALHTEKPAEAVVLFENLVRANAHSAPAQVNLFAARVRAAMRLEHGRDDQIERAVANWQSIQAGLNAEQRDRVAAAASYNMLLALRELSRKHSFNDLLEGLEPALRYSSENATLAIEYWRTIGAAQRASTFLAEAETHHGQSEWITRLTADLSRGEPSPVSPPPVVAATEQPPNPRELRTGFNEALSRSPDQIASIFGDSTQDLEAFLFDMHRQAAEAMLLLEAALVELRDEDKFNHIFAKLLAGQLRFLRWSISEGSPGGMSDGSGAVKGTSGGEGWRDWIVQAGSRELCVGEALRCNGGVDQGYVETHVNKLARYDPVGLSFAFLVAYVELADFDRAANKYRDIVANAVLADLPVSRTDDTLTGPARLKTFRSVHNRGTTEVTVYHLLIGLPRSKGVGTA